MSVKALLGRVIHSNAVGRQWAESRRLRQRERDWSTRHTARFGKTTLSLLTNVGKGDVMVARQFCAEFLTYCERHGDPGLGHIVITGGAWPVTFRLTRGDHNVYWWWSMNGQDGWLDEYLNRVDVKPDVVACLSRWCCDYARAAGSAVVYLPLAVGRDFQPLGIPRHGIGFAGSKGHKDSAQVACMLGPFVDRPEFEWATGIKTPEDLSRFYNSRKIVLGMTEVFQEKTGMVNNRVFEVLATGTPFLIHRHRAVEEVLGQPFPYQADTAEQASNLAETILADYPGHLEIFAGYQRVVDAEHRYANRIHTLMQFLSKKG